MTEMTLNQKQLHLHVTKPGIMVKYERCRVKIYLSHLQLCYQTSCELIKSNTQNTSCIKTAFYLNTTLLEGVTLNTLLMTGVQHQTCTNIER